MLSGVFPASCTLNYWTVQSCCGDRFSTCGEFECNNCSSSICSSIICAVWDPVYPMHPFYCVIPVPYVPVRVTRGDLVTHRYTYERPRCRTSQFRRTFITFSVALCNDLSCLPCIRWCSTCVFQQQDQSFFYWPLATILSCNVFFCPSFSIACSVGLGSMDWKSLNRTNIIIMIKVYNYTSC